MDLPALKNEITNIRDFAPRAEQRDEHHEKLFEVFRGIDAALGEITGAPLDEARAEGLIEAQTVVIRTASALPARTMKDLLYKLAIWRWDAPELDRPTETMSRGDAIVYSAFRDLANLLGETAVLKDFDKAN